jgi:hypothetical protein
MPREESEMKTVRADWQSVPEDVHRAATIWKETFMQPSIWRALLHAAKLTFQSRPETAGVFNPKVPQPVPQKATSAGGAQ